MGVYTMRHDKDRLFNPASFHGSLVLHGWDAYRIEPIDLREPLIL